MKAGDVSQHGPTCPHRKYWVRLHNEGHPWFLFSLRTCEQTLCPVVSGAKPWDWTGHQMPPPGELGRFPFNRMSRETSIKTTCRFWKGFHMAVCFIQMLKLFLKEWKEQLEGQEEPADREMPKIASLWCTVARDHAPHQAQRQSKLHRALEVRYRIGSTIPVDVSRTQISWTDIGLHPWDGRTSTHGMWAEESQVAFGGHYEEGGGRKNYTLAELHGIQPVDFIIFF